jgi:hypothetical protein
MCVLELRVCANEVVILREQAETSDLYSWYLYTVSNTWESYRVLMYFELT